MALTIKGIEAAKPRPDKKNGKEDSPPCGWQRPLSGSHRDKQTLAGAVRL